MSSTDGDDRGMRGIGPRGSRAQDGSDERGSGWQHSGRDDGYSSTPGTGRAPSAHRGPDFEYDPRDPRFGRGPYDGPGHTGSHATGGYRDPGRGRDPYPPDRPGARRGPESGDTTAGRRAAAGPGGPYGPNGPRGPHRPGGRRAADGPGGPGGRGRKAKRSKLRTALIIVGFSFLTLMVGGLATFAIAYQMTKLPNENDLATAKTTIIYAADGKSEIGRFAAQNRVPVSFDQLPSHVGDTVVAAENQSFWTDSGFDAIGMARAAFGNVTGTSSGGASTITQQYVKNFYLTPDRSIERKIRELFISLKVEQQMSKKKILESYLNTSFYGRGSWGVQTAARAYFDKKAENLTLEESAVLASLLKAPYNYDPAENDGDTSRLEGRFRYVLNGMVEMGKIDQATARNAELPEIVEPSLDESREGPNGYIVAAVKGELNDMGFTDEQINAGGLRVTTTIEPKVQRALEKSVKKNFPKKEAKGVHAGAAAVRPGTGEVLAMYGGEDYLERQWNDATQAELQPGSTFKPFALAAGLEKGVSLYDRFPGNTPYWVEDKKIKPNRVQNEFDEDYGESVDLLTATAKSINTAYVAMTMEEIGTRPVLDAAVRAGVPKNADGLRPMPKISLGFASVAPIDMANAYATFAAEGYSAERHLISGVIGDSGEVLKEHNVKVSKAFEKDVMRDLTYALQEVVENGSGEKEASKVGRPAAGKTGTHEDETAWFVGYTPQISASVAFYKDADGDGVKEPLDGIGGRDTFFGGGFPAKIWAGFMKDALKGEPKQDFAPPANIGEDDTSDRDEISDPSTPTPTPTPTETDTPTPTPTPTETDTPTPTPTPTDTDPGPTPGPGPTETDDPDPTPDPTGPTMRPGG